MENDMKILIALVCMVGFLSGMSMLMLMNSESGLNKEDVQNVVALEVSKIEIPMPVIPEQKLDMTEFNAKIAEMQIVIDSIVDEDKISEAKAEEIALLEVEMSRSFRRLIVSVLNDNGIYNESVEDYRDIVEIYNIEVENFNETSEEVIIEFKVRYYNDGDDEEEDLQKAKLSVAFEIEGLDYDDEYEDLEVTNESLEVLKIYE